MDPSVKYPSLDQEGRREAIHLLLQTHVCKKYTSVSMSQLSSVLAHVVGELRKLNLSQGYLTMRESSR